MTNLGEARCAREAEIAYATIAMITDYDAWKTDEAHVTVEMIIENLHKNAEMAKAVVARTIPLIPEELAWPRIDCCAMRFRSTKKLCLSEKTLELGPILAKYL